jgi:hypothetical protein
MARTPSRVPGILINKFGRRARSNIRTILGRRDGASSFAGQQRRNLQ